MPKSSNSFENLIECFNKICCCLENDTEIRLKQISDNRMKELNLNAEILKRFDDLMGDISETCSELIIANNILHSLNKNYGNNFLPMSYKIQSDTVKSINKLFNMPQLSKDSDLKKIDVEQKKELLKVLVALAEKNISDVKDTENIALEMKDLI